MGLGISSPGEERVQPRGFERSKIIEGGTEREGKNRSGDSHEQTLQNGELERGKREGGRREREHSRDGKKEWRECKPTTAKYRTEKALFR